ncbi:PH domain-containing protein [Kitasatospora sp. NPDC050543]|uniref:PH domain-containing protein n=1 Tax=Kitasatospora sp. NPDC050543 TaxID=3364054 RepID=UPI0037A35816
MSHETLPREYRAGPGRAGILLGILSFSTVAGLLPVWSAEDVSGGIKWLITGLAAALIAWLVIGAQRASTTADLKSIRVRGLVRQRRLAWEDIQDIRKEINPQAGAHKEAPRFFVFAYGRDAGRLQLLYIDDKHVNVDREVAALRAAWEELRGEDWTPDADAARRIDRRELRMIALMSGLSWTMITFPALVVVMLLPLFIELPDGLKSVLNPGTVAAVGTPALFVCATLMSWWRHRAD